jgi:hypothetical protein
MESVGGAAVGVQRGETSPQDKGTPSQMTMGMGSTERDDAYRWNRRASLATAHVPDHRPRKMSSETRAGVLAREILSLFTVICAISQFRIQTWENCICINELK